MRGVSGVPLTLNMEVGLGHHQSLGVDGHPGAVRHPALPDAQGVAEAIARDDEPLVLVDPLAIESPHQSSVLGRDHALEGGVLSLADRDVVKLSDELHCARG